MTAPRTPSSPMADTALGAIRVLLGDVRRRLEMDVALVAHFADGKRVIDLVDAGEPVSLSEGDWDPIGLSFCQQIVDGNLPELLTDASADPVARGLPATDALAIGAHVGVPIVLDDGTVYGTLCAYSHARRPDLDERATSILGLVADTIAGALVRDHEERRAREDLLARIDTLLSDELLDMAYQPLVDLSSRKAVAVEALARFPTSVGRVPGDWFADAAAVGAASDLELACLQRASHDLPLLHGLDVHLNLSAGVLLQPATAARLEVLPLQRIVLELTGRDGVDDDRLDQVLAPLRARGLRLAIDDAGAALDSFRRVLQLKPDLVKLDASLVRGIDQDVAKRSLCQALTGFVHATAARVVAEGVESEGEARVLLALGVDLAQGYLFGRPVPLSELPREDAPVPPQVTVAPGADATADDLATSVASLAAGGASSATIAAALNRQGLLAPSGRRWHATSVTRLLLPSAGA